MKLPIILINYKVYDNSYGNKAIELGKKIEKISKDHSVEVILSVPSTMIYRMSQEIDLPIYAQHVDSNSLGAFTGTIPPELIKDAGAKGTLLNHSEKRMRADEIDDVLKRLKNLGLESVLCVDRYELVYPFSLLKPNAILIEPPELIGTGISVSRAKPEVITRAVEEISKNKDVYLIAGAGITNGEDVFRAIKLGAQGIGVASAVMKAKEPDKVVEDLIISALKAMDLS
ncbi:triose-phosphate isomerase [Sulfolobus sp. B1]|uniref:triose-phosphate isomerase n=1 Tax=Sulfolobaceae TaxID=118883 RepID=UPI000845DAFD|nr:MULTISPECIES: triose-phosphate isomerase [unclassified Sulfolobus]TRM78720.1 triose-phosphate isomerase [Sulfolobus sp. A20-N-F8]TRM81694.1 triose-phosphate isomerase [Sulfolobus sp. D5]TRM87905.1 triose-phosphate isomerase [Sulfolobus sp. C3]TRM95539.1 triose-phosphate isomerase [Sulfolobus sp. A20-N-G8]TRM98409.1 triose-phosphate isomerase [Sulfolobus sp. F1]